MKNYFIPGFILIAFAVLGLVHHAKAVDRNVRYYHANAHLGRIYKVAVPTHHGRINARPILHSMVKPHAHLAARVSMHNFDHGMNERKFNGYVFPHHGDGLAHLPDDTNLPPNTTSPPPNTKVMNWYLY
jgi:hypothetical protein